MGAAGAAKEIAAGLNAVADYFAAAMFAFRSQRVDGAFEAIVVMRDSIHDNLHRLVVFVSTNFTLHGFPFLPVDRISRRL